MKKISILASLLIVFAISYSAAWFMKANALKNNAGEKALSFQNGFFAVDANYESIETKGFPFAIEFHLSKAKLDIAFDGKKIPAEKLQNPEAKALFDALFFRDAMTSPNPVIIKTNVIGSYYDITLNDMKGTSDNGTSNIAYESKGNASYRLISDIRLPLAQAFPSLYQKYTFLRPTVKLSMVSGPSETKIAGHSGKATSMDSAFFHISFPYITSLEEEALQELNAANITLDFNIENAVTTEATKLVMAHYLGNLTEMMPGLDMTASNMVALSPLSSKGRLDISLAGLHSETPHITASIKDMYYQDAGTMSQASGEFDIDIPNKKIDITFDGDWEYNEKGYQSLVSQLQLYGTMPDLFIDDVQSAKEAAELEEFVKTLANNAANIVPKVHEMGKMRFAVDLRGSMDKNSPSGTAKLNTFIIASDDYGVALHGEIKPNSQKQPEGTLSLKLTNHQGLVNDIANYYNRIAPFFSEKPVLISTTQKTALLSFLKQISDTPNTNAENLVITATKKGTDAKIGTLKPEQASALFFQFILGPLIAGQMGQ